MASRLVALLVRYLQLQGPAEDDVQDRLLASETISRFRTSLGVFVLWNLENAFRVQLESDVTPTRTRAVEAVNLELEKVHLETWGLDLSREEQVRVLVPDDPSMDALRRLAVVHFIERRDDLESALLRHLLRT